ncbi:MAG: SGNH/GDSL hydrolase family protein [Deltaproteobacteria bacterium]|nr:SGNH/GDSL hydrolase family protein [Deltaproteobacteria bacterium]
MKYTFLLILTFGVIAFAFIPTAKSLADSAIQNAESANSAVRDWHGVRVLHIGDSNLENWGLKGTLRKKFKQAGADYTVSAWKGSSSRSWLRSGRLQRLLQKKAPHVVLVNLGTNISKADDPTVYMRFVTSVAMKIAPRECYWVAPPPLIDDEHGFYNMLQSASKPCIFLDSRRIDFEIPANRRVFHLDKRQSTVWAEQIWKWLNEPTVPPESVDGV